MSKAKSGSKGIFFHNPGSGFWGLGKFGGLPVCSWRSQRLSSPLLEGAKTKSSHLTANRVEHLVLDAVPGAEKSPLTKFQFTKNSD